MNCYSLIHRMVIAFAIGAISVEAETLKLTQLENGNTIEVKPIEFKDGSIRFQYNGREYNFATEKLTDDSRKAIEAWSQEQNAAGEALDSRINEAIGLTLFSSGNTLWEEPAGTVAGRLEWPAESEESAAETSSSYRKYPRGDGQLFGTRAYCCTLYADSKGKAESLSLVFANKGDFNSSYGFGRNHFNEVDGGKKVAMTLNEVIRKDTATISAKLTEILGEPTEQRYGEKEDRRDVLRWDHRGHSFVLSEREDEYAHLLITAKENADNEGRVDFIKDSDFRDMLEANVQKKDNGDVLITNIPMVNQGPKGYCAPATFERAMRYMQVPADMYLLATLATGAEGGTYTPILAAEAKRIINSKARRIKNLQLGRDLDMRLVQRYIDKGVPILWQMASVDPYNDAANKMTKIRSAVTDFADWPEQLAEMTESTLPKLSNQSHHHICLIIGYNEATGEVAVSDSWGPEYALRWVPIEVAKAVTTSGGFVIDL